MNILKKTVLVTLTAGIAAVAFTTPANAAGKLKSTELGKTASIACKTIWIFGRPIWICEDGMIILTGGDYPGGPIFSF